CSYIAMSAQHTPPPCQGPPAISRSVDSDHRGQRDEPGGNALHESSVGSREKEITADSAGQGRRNLPPGRLTVRTSAGVSDEDPCRSCSAACWTRPQRECLPSGTRCT